MAHCEPKLRDSQTRVLRAGAAAMGPGGSPGTRSRLPRSRRTGRGRQSRAPHLRLRVPEPLPAGAEPSVSSRLPLLGRWLHCTGGTASSGAHIHILIPDLLLPPGEPGLPGNGKTRSKEQESSGCFTGRRGLPDATACSSPHAWPGSIPPHTHTEISSLRFQWGWGSAWGRQIHSQQSC